jgi:DNA primase
MLKINNTTFNTDVLAVLEKLQLELRSKGSKLLKQIKPIKDYVMITCPYHKNGEERRASSQVREKDGLFYCFNCKVTKSLPEVITDCLNEDGWNWLIRNFKSVETQDRQVNLDFDRNKSQEETKFIDKKELEKYRFIHPYVYERKLNLEIIRKFDVGFDKESNCITFPVKDKDGNILFIARRSVKSKFFNYPYGVKKPLYGEYELLRELKHGIKIDEIYICEAIFDALTLWSWGYYAIALNGLGSEEQYKQLMRLPIRTLILATDNDEAGKNARKQLKRKVTNKIIKELSYDCYGNCKDINDMTLEQFQNCEVILF